MNLYEINAEIAETMELLVAAENWKPQTNENGETVDEYGNAVSNADEYKAGLIEALTNTLDSIKVDFEEKASSVAAYIKNLKSDAEQLKKEEQALKARREAKENAIKRIQQYLLDAMTAAGKKKLDTPRACISIRNNAESVKVTDERALMLWAQENEQEDILIFRDPEISKSAIKNAIKRGASIPFIELVQTQSVVIK